MDGVRPVYVTSRVPHDPPPSAGGTRASKKEGHYVPGRPPYGYERYKLDGRGWSLRPVEPQAGVIRTIYDMYLSGKGFSEIANELNAMKIRTPLDKKWVPATTRAILQNPHYAGFIPSAMKVNTKIVQKGKLITSDRSIKTVSCTKEYTKRSSRGTSGTASNSA